MEAIFVRQKAKKLKTNTFLSFFFVTFDENILTDRISKSDILVIFMIFGHGRPFPPRKLILGTIGKAETDSSGSKLSQI